MFITKNRFLRKRFAQFALSYKISTTGVHKQTFSRRPAAHDLCNARLYRNKSLRVFIIFFFCMNEGNNKSFNIFVSFEFYRAKGKQSFSLFSSCLLKRYSDYTIDAPGCAEDVIAKSFFLLEGSSGKDLKRCEFESVRIVCCSIYLISSNPITPKWLFVTLSEWRRENKIKS